MSLLPLSHHCHARQPPREPYLPPRTSQLTEPVEAAMSAAGQTAVSRRPRLSRREAILLHPPIPVITETGRHCGPLATASAVSVKEDHSAGTDREHHAGLATSKRGSARMPTPSCYDRTLERAVSFVVVAPGTTGLDPNFRPLRPPGIVILRVSARRQHKVPTAPLSTIRTSSWRLLRSRSSSKPTRSVSGSDSSARLGRANCASVFLSPWIRGHLPPVGQAADISP